jgi:hypothetical protein
VCVRIENGIPQLIALTAKHRPNQYLAAATHFPDPRCPRFSVHAGPTKTSSAIVMMHEGPDMKAVANQGREREVELSIHLDRDLPAVCFWRRH